ncbi:MAG: hypothetical protein FWF29_00580 [Treponema sp.]|nr:hypothetical protein [Treponema sp.]
MKNLPGRVFQTIPGYEDHLARELEFRGVPLSGTENWGPLLYSPAAGVPVYWNQNTWLNPVLIEFDSINEAAAALRGMGRNWAPCLFTQYRRGTLIKSKLPGLPDKKHRFPWLLPDTPMGAFTLLDDHNLVASAQCSSPFPGGIIEFEEDREGPPSRAYLKLWEAMTLCRKWPQTGQRCLDAGASPGGWTWALSRLGADVLAVDRSALDEKISRLENVEYLKHDAFTLQPQDTGKLDWLFCDVICYPPRLYEWTEKWLSSGLCENFICTIKMQGDADFETTELFTKIPDSRIIHLWHNKHELTWIKIKPSDQLQNPVSS